MSSATSNQIVFFFGAGASAPFGIPTMKQFVTDFEESLIENGTEGERGTYTDIKKTLEKQLHRQVDLEGIFTVIDGIIDYAPERLGLLSLYATAKFKKPFPTEKNKEICKSLREKFQTFVKEKCAIPEGSFGRIAQVYQDFFNRFFLELGGNAGGSGNYVWNPTWTVFTTNYDTCLEYFWREAAGANIDTGFDYNNVRKVDILNARKLLSEGMGMQLFKLHGSVNWLIEKRSKKVIEVTERGRSYVGRKYEGEMMIYPIAEKELYFDPYISMLLRLNRELESKSVWVVIGYSFNDPIVREIFLRKSNARKHLVLVHSKARDVFRRRLHSMKAKMSLMEKWFGLSEKEEDLLGEYKKENYKKVNHQIISMLKENPRFKWHDNVVP